MTQESPTCRSLAIGPLNLAAVVCLVGNQITFCGSFQIGCSINMCKLAICKSTGITNSNILAAKVALGIRPQVVRCLNSEPWEVLLTPNQFEQANIGVSACTCPGIIATASTVCGIGVGAATLACVGIVLVVATRGVVSLLGFLVALVGVGGLVVVIAARDFVEMKENRQCMAQSVETVGKHLGLD